MSSPAPVIVTRDLRHTYGSGSLRNEVLHGIDVEISEGEIILFTGPSGSGKTTLLTLVGALRSAQKGSLEVLGQQLLRASEAKLVEVRRKIGYVFQGHNLLDSLSARENVEVALQLHPHIPRRRRRAKEMLQSVGLAEHVNRYPKRLSGGQRQRVAIARALAAEPRIVLADEPTASLDKKTGREVIDLLKALAREQGVCVVVVTHDPRILDMADRVLHLEDGRLSPPATTIMTHAGTLMTSMAHTFRTGELSRSVAGLEPAGMVKSLESFTQQGREFHKAMKKGENEAIHSMLEQVLETFTRKVCEMLNADRTTIFLFDEASQTLWSKFARGPDGNPLEIRLPVGQGIAGHVAVTGEVIRLADAYESEYFDPATDERTGYRTTSVLCMPITSDEGKLFAVVQAINKAGDLPFDERDERRLGELLPSVGGVVESWIEMGG